jgi:hypothetical protein
VNKTIKIELTLPQLARLQALVALEKASHETTTRTVSYHIKATTIELEKLLLEARRDISRELGISQR